MIPEQYTHPKRVTWLEAPPSPEPAPPLAFAPIPLASAPACHWTPKKDYLGPSWPPLREPLPDRVSKYLKDVAEDMFFRLDRKKFEWALRVDKPTSE